MRGGQGDMGYQLREEGEEEHEREMRAGEDAKQTHSVQQTIVVTHLPREKAP